MAGEMFGSPIGQHIAEGDIARMSMLPLQMQQLQDQHELAPFRAAQYAANARHRTAAAGKLEEEVSLQRRIAARVQGAAPQAAGEQQDLNPAWTFAKAAMDEGSPELAIKYADKAAGIDSKIAAADTQGARRALIEGRGRIVNMDNLSRDMLGVADAAGLQNALVAHEKRTGERTGMLDAEGILLPQFADQWEGAAKLIRERAISEKDRTLATYRTKVLESNDLRRKARTKEEEFWRDMSNQESRAAAQARGRGAKGGAGTITNADFLRGATDYVKNQFLLSDDNEAKVRGRAIAEQAKQLRDANPALTPQEAIKQVFDRMDKGGKFEGLKRKPPQASPKNALALPASGKTSDLKTGHFYTDASGQVRQWLGPDKKWSGPTVTGKIRPATYGAAAVEDEMDDDEEASAEDDDSDEEE